MKLKDFFKKKKIAAGCIAAVITAGSLAMVWQGSQVPELPNYTDPVIEQTIEDDDTPLASAPKITTKTTKNTKTTRKNIKLKTASKKTYTKKSSTTTVKTQTTVQTATKQKYTKKSKNVVQTQKVTTTVKTTTTVVAAAAKNNTTTNVSDTKTDTAATVKQEKYSVSNVASIAPKMDGRVLNAYTKMGFTVTVDPSVSYAGYFNAANRSITLRTEDNTVYHELGHYLAFIAGNVDKSSAFASVYNSEKSNFTGVNKAYATQNASEYFAESVLNYVENPSVLKAQRPKTYEAVQNAFDKITDERVDKIIKVYSAVWK